MRSSYLLTASLAALLAACGDDATLSTVTEVGDPRSSVTVTLATSGLRLTNVGTTPLAYAVFERTRAALIMFGPCLDPGPSCVRLPAGQTVTVPFSEIGGWAAGAREAVVYTWRVVPNPSGGYRMADFTSQVVRL
jgi:hypothetical protein